MKKNILRFKYAVILLFLSAFCIHVKAQWAYNITVYTIPSYNYGVPDVGWYPYVIPKGVGVWEGTDRAFIPVDSTGYKLHDIIVDDVSQPDAVANGTYTFYNVQNPHTIKFVFRIITSLLLSDKTVTYNGQPQNITPITKFKALEEDVTAGNGEITYKYFLDGIEQSGLPANAGDYKVVTYYAGSPEGNETHPDYMRCETTDTIIMTTTDRLNQ